MDDLLNIIKGKNLIFIFFSIFPTKKVFCCITDILAGIKEIDFTETDIRARTELSEARILYDKVQLLIFGKIELSSIQEKVDTVDSLVNDLLQYINQGMSSVNQATQWNQNNQNKIKEVDSKCRATAELKSNFSQALTNGRQLVEEGRTILDSSRKHYNELTNIQGRFLNREKALDEREIGLSRVVEDYRYRLKILKNKCQNFISLKIQKLFVS